MHEIFMSAMIKIRSIKQINRSFIWFFKSKSCLLFNVDHRSEVIDSLTIVNCGSTVTCQSYEILNSRSTQ